MIWNGILTWNFEKKYYLHLLPFLNKFNSFFIFFWDRLNANKIGYMCILLDTFENDENTCCFRRSQTLQWSCDVNKILGIRYRYRRFIFKLKARPWVSFVQYRGERGKFFAVKLRHDMCVIWTNSLEESEWLCYTRY